MGLQEKESRPKINGHSFLTRIFALRRLSLISTSQEDENLRSSVGAIFASVNVGTAQTFENGAKLLRVAEIGPQGRRRPINMSLVWIGRISNEKVSLRGREREVFQRLEYVNFQGRLNII